ncbi:MAG: thioredoxin domain-containing protein, partial [Acidobacteria bacterium]|nr:thioredoxin domain-containing protein [Acidobacteriota bacterium]
MHDPKSTSPNHLAAESSPYLLLHKDNPVDWYPWGEEALAKARREDKPIFLSVGYSTCYWCHVMERESFTDPAVAELMNEHFVSIKVDREERPDLDEVYMAATQVLTGQGGWPNSVFLTPELEPFYAGTYFPPSDRHGRPGFATVLRSVADAWRARRDQVELAADQVTAHMRTYLEEQRAPLGHVPGPEVARRSLAALAGRFDAEWGGFGAAPKFPTPSNLYLLLEMADEAPEAGEMLAATLDRMARGGIYDQLGG